MLNKKNFVRMMSVALVLVTLLSIMAVSASATTWKTGNVPHSGNSGYTTVYLSNTKKDAKIKIHSYAHTNIIKPSQSKEVSTNFHITMRTTSGRWLWEGDITTGSKGKTMNLGKDNRAYKICIRQNSVPFGSWSQHYADYWGIECVKNCYM